MNVKPVKHRPIPAYPTRLEALADPGLLSRNVPHNWNQNTLTATALGVFLAANSCLRADGGGKSSHPKAAVVAPIFEHGNGRGATGCVVVVPPVFLSEEEALQVIAEELSQSGIKITSKNVVLEGVTIPRRRERFRSFKEGFKVDVENDPEKAAPLAADGMDDTLRVAVEYVSESDYFDLGGPRSFSTVQSYDFKKVAVGIAQAVENKGPGVYFGTFYNPMPEIDPGRTGSRQDWTERWRRMHEEGGTEARRLLHLQVKDFIDWLKGQGVI
jgi:hypothetical protein